MIMGKEHIRSHAMKGETNQESDIDNTGFHTADVQHSPADDLLAVGACPPEDAVGIHGYDQMLEAVKSPKSDEAKEYREWLGLTKGEQWDPSFCSVRLVNKRLCLIERVYRSWLKIKRICRIYILLPVVMGRVKQPQALPSSLKF
jgi:hypothetical protein